MTDLAEIRGRALTRLVEELGTLCTIGEAAGSALREIAAGRDAGLWYESGSRAVATARLVDLGDRLPAPAESLPAVVSLVPEVRRAWLGIVLARLREIGERGDLSGLCDGITTAGALAVELVADLRPSLDATAYSDLERLVLPSAAHEAPAYPVLLRALAVTSPLVQSPPQPAEPLEDAVWDDPSRTWRKGRLIRLPSVEERRLSGVVLTGALDESAGEGDPMRWTLHRPWAYLLAQMVFTKEAWEAEGISGRLSFELADAGAALHQAPPRVEVVVTLPSGEEVSCGLLGEFALQVLEQLGVRVLGHSVNAAMLDTRLAGVIEALLRREVWKFEHGSGGRNSEYGIHSSFSDACYRALGSKAYYRLGSPVTGAIRRVAENWARERLARKGSKTEGTA